MRDTGLDVKPQVASRPIGILIGLEATASPFLFTQSVAELTDLPLAGRVLALRDPERKHRVLEEHAANRRNFIIATPNAKEVIVLDLVEKQRTDMLNDLDLNRPDN